MEQIVRGSVDTAFWIMLAAIGLAAVIEFRALLAELWEIVVGLTAGGARSHHGPSGRARIPSPSPPTRGRHGRRGTRAPGASSPHTRGDPATARWMKPIAFGIAIAGILWVIDLIVPGERPVFFRPLGLLIAAVFVTAGVLDGLYPRTGGKDRPSATENVHQEHHNQPRGDDA